MTKNQNKTKKILFLPGDGIGPEVVNEAYKVIQTFNKYNGNLFEIDYADIGGVAYDLVKTPLPEETLEKAKESDAILLGAVGGPKWESLDYKVRQERGLLGIRKELELFANLRPAIVYNSLADSSSLKPHLVSNLDIMIVRELTGGIYFGEPRGVEVLKDNTRRGYNTLVYNSTEVSRIAKVAFEIASKREGRVCSVYKANVLEATEMWREEVEKVGKYYKDVKLSHMYVDNASMQLVREPKQFDVIVTTNMFGDILSDTAAMLTGSLGMLPSASLGEKQKNGKQYALYEPVHGSAPDITGKNIANPIATISSIEMMLRYSFNMSREADILNVAIKSILDEGYRTQDILGEKNLDIEPISTSAMGDLIVKELEKYL